MSMLPRRPYVTTRTHKVFAIAHDLADRLGHGDVTPTHLTLGLISEGRSIAAAILHARVPLDVLERDLNAHLPQPGTPRVPVPDHSWISSDERVLEQATVEARELGNEYFGCEHLLLAFLRDPTSALAQVLAKHGVHFDDVRTDVLRANNARPNGGTSAVSSGV